MNNSFHHDVASSAAIVGLPGRPAVLDASDEALVRMADPGLDSRVVIMAPGALELSCALLHRGFREVTIARTCDRPVVGHADIVIIPQIESAVALSTAVACARRMLAPLGTIVIRIAADVPDVSVQSAMRDLSRNGFARERTRFVFADAVLRAELPLYGQLQCA